MIIAQNSLALHEPLGRRPAPSFGHWSEGSLKPYELPFQEVKTKPKKRKEKLRFRTQDLDGVGQGEPEALKPWRGVERLRDAVKGVRRASPREASRKLLPGSAGRRSALSLWGGGKGA